MVTNKHLAYALLASGLTLSATQGLAQVPKQRASSLATTEVFGSVIYGDGWSSQEDAPYGIYSVMANNDASLQLVKKGTQYMANGGGVYIAGLYYMIGYEVGYWGEIAGIYFRVYDVENDWQLVREKKLEGLHSIPADLTYSPTDDCVYGCFWTDDQQTFTFGKLNLLTGEATLMATLKEQLVALAARRDGALYGIGVSGILYRIDLTNGVDLQQVGVTGLTVRYAQSATFDHATDRLLWSATMHDVTNGSALYEVNPATGSVSYLNFYPNGMQFTGIYTQHDAAYDAAPAKVSGAAFQFDKAALSGQFAFTMPTTTYGGAALSSDGLAYSLVIDDDPACLLTASATAGQSLSLPYSFPAPGMHMLRISATDGAGRGPVTTLYRWIGQDKAKALNPTLTQTPTALHVSWTAPSTGVNGGYINADKLTYQVVRMPDNVLVYEGANTEVDDAVSLTELKKYWYNIIAIADGQVGESAQTNQLMLGNAVSVPYTQNFTDADAFDFFTVVDANHDDISWMHIDDYAAYEYSEKVAADDWLITPPLALSADYVYQVSTKVKALTTVLPERFELCLGSAPTVDAMQTSLLAPTLVNWGDYQEITTQIRPTSSGSAYVGIHAISDANQNMLCMDAISVKALASALSPDSITQLTAVAAADGARQATLTFTLPTKALNGTDAAGVQRVEIYRNNTLITTLTDVADGQTCSYVDTGAAQGFNTYSVAACNAHEGSIRTSTKVYVGEDVPASVPSLQLTDEGAGLLSLTWNEPVTGVNGGYINRSELTYDVDFCGYRNKATGLTERNFSEQITYPTNTQKLIWYTVTANTSTGKGTVTQSDTLFLGDAYKLPFVESFSHKTPDKGSWNPLSDGVAEWKVDNNSVDTQDADGGSVVFSPKMPNTSAEFVSPKIDLTGHANPVLTYWVWHHRQANNQLSLFLRKSDGSELLLDTFASNDLGTSDNDYEWRQHTVALKNYAVDDASHLVFRAVNKSFDLAAVNYLAVDNIQIRNVFDHDLRALSLEGNLEVKVGEPIAFQVKIDNRGANVESDYQVKLFRDGQPVDSVAGISIRPNYTKTFTLTDVPNADAAQTSHYYAEVVLAGDGDTTNDRTNTQVVTVQQGLPYVSDLKGTTTGSTTQLTWSVPPTVAESANAASGEVTDDFETYASFSITNAGEWTLYDGDGAQTAGILNNHGNFIEYDNVEKPMAFMVFAPTEAGLTATTWQPHSGKHVMASFLSDMRVQADDDWLISPELDGTAQTIRFWAKAPDRSYYDTYEDVELLYSTTDTKPSSFTKVGQTLRIDSETWKSFFFNVPEGAKYFAFRKISKDQYILYIDDVTYRPASKQLDFQGYHVYRNGARLTASPIAATTYTDEAQGVQNYYVTAVYAAGESRASNVYCTDPTAIGAVTAQPAFRVSTARGVLHVDQPADATVRIYAADGRLLTTLTGRAQVALPQGVYVVKGTAHQVKAAVR